MSFSILLTCKNEACIAWHLVTLSVVSNVCFGQYSVFWSSLRCQPNLLHSIKEFNRYYMQPLKLARMKDAKQNVIELGQKRQKELTQTLKGVLLQRSKECFLKNFLKNKDDRVLFCELSEVQKELYKHILALPDFILLSTSSIPCDCGVNRDFFLSTNRWIL